MARVDDMAGETFGKYVVVRRLAVGGMAEVCLARLEGAAGFNKLVVVKQVLPQFAEDPQFIEMFLDEGRLAARLSHPNIAQTFELGEDRGRYFMAMEYVAGRSLFAIFEALAERKEQLPLACAMRITMQLLEALGYAHAVRDARGKSLNLVHRDVTPSNVMVTFDGSVKLLDFGIAKAAAQMHKTRAGRVKGKAGYMSPEQCRGKDLDARSDLYSAGALLYQMTTGRRPFEDLMNGADPVVVMQATLKGGFAKPTEVAPSLPGAIDDIVLKAMALKADDRYANAGQMLRELESFSTAMGIYPSTQKLSDLVQQLFPGASDEIEDAVTDRANEPARPPLPPPPVALREKPGPPVPTLPELKPVVSASSLGIVPRADAAPGESGVQTQVGARDPDDVATYVNPAHRPAVADAAESQTSESPMGPEGFAPEDSPSEPEIPTELSGHRKAKKPKGLPVAWLALAFAGATGLGLLGVTLLAPAPAPVVPRTSPQKAAEPIPAPPPTPEEIDTGIVRLDATPPATVTWGETDFGETPIEAAVPTGEQSFVFHWGTQTFKTVRLVVPPGDTIRHHEKR